MLYLLWLDFWMRWWWRRAARTADAADNPDLLRPWLCVADIVKNL